MKMSEDANVGVVIGFIVTAIVLAIGVVKTLVLSKETVSTNPLSGTVGHSRNRQYKHLVHDPVKPGNHNAVRIQPAFDCTHCNGGRWDPRRPLHVGRK